MLNLPNRPRRNRQNPALRNLIEETKLHVHDFIAPLFVHAKTTSETIDAMPGCSRFSINDLIKECGELVELGIQGVILFPAVAEELKTSCAAECFNPDGLIPQTIKAIKAQYPQLLVITDIALDPYNSDGHDGIVSADKNGDLTILNDETVATLCKQALCHAQAGADIVAPSDMMDGRIGEIRAALDDQGFTEIAIMAYTAKYASAYYGPFRGALESAPKAGDKKTYQMNPANTSEAFRELELDQAEHADIIMVKPAGSYLDIIYQYRQQSNLPIAAYQVSGEYLMIEAGSAAGWLDKDKLVEESLLSIKRAGAHIIVSYYSKYWAQKLQK